MKMTRNLLLFASFILAMTSLVSCSSKATAISDLEQFTTTLEEQSSNFSKTDWEKATEQYKEIKAKIDEENLTSEEKAQVDSLKQRCAAIVTRNAVNDIMDNFGDLGTVLKSIVEDKGLENAADQLLGGLNEGLQVLTEQLKKVKKEDIEKTKESVKDVMKELERLAKDLGEDLDKSGALEKIVPEKSGRTENGE